jgi:hypothetical protein
MGNTLTGLIPDAYVALDVVSRELTGFVPAVARDPKADGIAVGQTLEIPITPANSAGGNVTPAMSLPSASDQTITPKTLTITKSRYYPFSWSGEEQAAVEGGPGFLTLQQGQIAEAIRKLINEMEADIAAAAYKGASRAYGTSASTPFASDLSDPANLRKILDDNGAPKMDRSLVIDTTAGAKLRTLSNVTKANEAGDNATLRQGVLLDLHGFAIRESAQVSQLSAVGTGSGWVFNGTHAIGVTTLTVKSGSGTILAGDVLSFQNDTNKYVVATALSSTTVIIAAPGLKKQHTDSETITVNAAFTPNVGFSRNAILLATRLPKVPEKGDLATDREVITDPRTGISFELAYYPGYHMGVYQVAASWGVSVIKPEHAAILLG